MPVVGATANEVRLRGCPYPMRGCSCQKCDRTYVLNEAIDSYLETHRWQIKEIKKAIAEAEAGDFASEEEVEAVFAKLTHES